jgi:Putative zinc-finger
MDHQEALRLQAVEKYLLGELTTELREQFEEHYFDCPECATGLRSLGTFVTASRLVLKEEEMPPWVSPQAARAKRPGWFNWLQPVISLPAIMALAALVVYQITVAIPSARKQAAVQSVAEVYESSYHLQGTTRGAEAARVTVRPDESFALDFDFIPTQIFPKYKGSLIDSSAQAVLIFSLKGEQSNKEVHLVIPGGKVHSGSYDLVVVGNSGTSNQEPENSEVLRLTFVVGTEPEIIHSGDRPATKE